MTGIDPITTEVIAQSLQNIAVEAGVVLMRSAYSPNIKERHDCSTAVFDARGRVIAQAHHIPIHLGSMIGAIDALTARHPVSTMCPGDMYLANDPYTGGGSHLPDLSVIAPVFHAGTVVAYVANIAHHADVGGMVPGSEAAVCASIFQEGLRLPPVRLVAADEICRDIIDVVLLNSRTPDERAGDLRAQIAANRSACRNIEALYERYGDTVGPTMDAVLDSTEQRFRRAIAKVPNGEYRATEYLSGDTPDTRAPICARLTVADTSLHFDFEGTAPALSTARNIPRQALLATVYTVAKALLDPHVPANAGYFRTIECDAPAGSIVSPQPPAPVGARSISCGVLSDAVVAVLSAAQPDAGLAPSGPHHLLTWAGRDPRNGRYFVNYETIAGALGAFADRDGMDAVRTLASGSANLPVEAAEHAYPLRVARYALRDGSGGSGRFSGGRGIARDYLVLGDDVTVSLSAERQHEPARGVDGGGDARTGRFVVAPDTAAEQDYFSGAKEVPLARGATFRVLTPGGAGRGTPPDEN
ncbi:MAG: hydantoinase B/oxoprolinase family protein [Pseudomonadota bacterium]